MHYDYGGNGSATDELALVWGASYRSGNQRITRRSVPGLVPPKAVKWWSRPAKSRKVNDDSTKPPGDRM